MRRFLSLFMVLLLALRGLAGDAMAMEQNTVPPHPMGHEQSQSHAQHLDEMASMAQHLHHDMGSHHEAAPTSAATCSADAASSDCHQHEGHCTACGICHSTLATPELLSPHAKAPRAVLLAHGTARFASAAPFQLVKPPISVL